MGAREFRPFLTPSSSPRRFRPSYDTFFFVKDAVKPHTVILGGALLQILLSVLLPTRWALVPALALLLTTLTTTLLQALSPRPNEYTTHTIPGRATAQRPLPSGPFGTLPGAHPIVVFNLGAQFNHPLGPLAPGVRELGERFEALIRDLHSRREDLGLLGSQTWRADERRSNNTFVTTFYFKDVESVHRFAHEAMHRDTWEWFHGAKFKHIGVFHETFCVPAKAYETMYVNCRPTGMGLVSEGVEGGMWVNSLVSADTPALKTQYSRLSRTELGEPKEEQG